MKPVFQTLFGEEGNCFPACIASILEIPIDGIPNFCLHEDWEVRANVWLKIHHGLALIAIDMMRSQKDLPLFLMPAYHIMSGMGPRRLQHSVVAFMGKMIHDPHPDGTGLKSVTDYDFFVALDPAKNKRSFPVYVEDGMVRDCTTCALSCDIDQSCKGWIRKPPETCEVHGVVGCKAPCCTT